MTPRLDIRGLSKAFGSLVVADDIHFQLEPGARHALIGPNGAGKTTFVNLVSGALEPSAGTIALDGRDITGLDAAGRARAGIARTFQINQLFRDLPTIDNVALSVARRLGADRSLWRPLGRHGAVMDEASALLERLGLADDAARPVRALPYGRQRLVELAVALGCRPRVLLLDEPAAGVPSLETHLILDLLESLDGDMAMLIIEHDMEVVFRLARTVTVLVGGRVFASGTPAEIAADQGVRDVYLGEG
jgi:ABC-type branched-subunit amino acid transport system ATPase component